MYLIGASGHAKVILDILRSSGKTVVGFFDDDSLLTDLVGLPIHGSVNVSLNYEGEFIISIGNNSVRRHIAREYKHNYITGIHASAVISSSVGIGLGTVIMPNVSINADTYIGEHVIINTSASIDHDCHIEDFVHVSPNTTLSGDVRVGEGAHIGAGATIIQGITIGAWATVGAGAVIIKDVPPGVTVVGNPGRIIKK